MPASKQRHFHFFNQTKAVTLATKGTVADDELTRIRGLLFAEPIKKGEGALLLSPCNSIHMFGMTYAIDALFLDKHGRVVDMLKRIGPWRMSKVYFKAHDCLELPAGTIDDTATEVGDQILWRAPGADGAAPDFGEAGGEGETGRGSHSGAASRSGIAGESASGLGTFVSRAQNLLTFAYMALSGLWIVAQARLFFEIIGRDQAVFYLEESRLAFTDFLLYATAGALARTNPSHIYEPAAQTAAFNQLVAPLRAGEPIALQYAPPFFLFMLPFSSMPLLSAYVAFDALSLVGALVALVVLCRSLSALHGTAFVLFMLGFLASLPVWENIRLGSSGLIVLALLAGYVVLLIKRHDIGAGLMLAAIAVVKLHYLPFFFLPLLAMRRWRAAITAICAVAALIISSDLYFGAGTTFNHARAALLAAQTQPQFCALSLSSLVPASFAFSAALAVAMVGLLFVWWLWDRAARNTADPDGACKWAMALTALASILCNGYSAMPDAAVLAISAALTLVTVNAFALASSVPLTLRIWHWLFILTPLAGFALFIWWHALHQYACAAANPFLWLILAQLASGTAYFVRHYGSVSAPQTA